MTLLDEVHKVKAADSWNVRYHNNHVETWPSDRYSVLADNLLLDRKHMYPFQGDSRDYHILAKAARAIRNTPGLVCEIGLREGGGLKIILDELIASQKPWNVISIDPYGSIPFQGSDVEELDESDYTNAMKCATLEKMYRFVADYPKINWMFFPLTAEAFFGRFNDGVPVYRDATESLQHTYSLIHFDGPHETEEVLFETHFFVHKSQIGTMFVYDDVEHFYDHDQVEKYIFEHGFELIEKTDVKAMYRKAK